MRDNERRCYDSLALRGGRTSVQSVAHEREGCGQTVTSQNRRVKSEQRYIE